MPLIDSRPTSLLWQEHIPTLAKSDLSALDERDRETRDRALEEAATYVDKILLWNNRGQECSDKLAESIRALKGGS